MGNHVKNHVHRGLSARARDSVNKHLRSASALEGVPSDPHRGPVGTTGGPVGTSVGGADGVAGGEGAPLPEPEDPIAWILKGKDEGLVRLPFGKTEQLLTFVRSKVPVKVTAK